MPRRTKLKPPVGNPVNRKIAHRKIVSKHVSEAIKKKWQEPEYRAKKLPQARKNLLPFREVNSQQERQELYAKQLETIDRMLATHHVMSGSYMERWMRKNCPDVEIESGMPPGYYQEMLEFFHPELVHKLEQEWKREFNIT